MPGKYACLIVEDNGVGIEDYVKERIFEPFFTTKEIGKGTGLGLSMVYGIVKQHDGYINVYTEKGKGTSFKIYFPKIHEEADDAHQGKLPSMPEGGAETVLLAEDDPEVRMITKEILHGAGYTVLEAVDGEDAVRVFNEHKDEIQLLMFDVIMPKKSGKEAYEQIYTINPDIKILFTSGYTADIIHRKGVLEDGFHFLSKPSSPHKMLRKLREILDA
jgi:CheY-like chemotaxis protein